MIRTNAMQERLSFKRTIQKMNVNNNSLSFTLWMNSVYDVCKRHFEYNSKQERKKENVQFRLALVGAVKLKYKPGDPTLNEIGGHIARVIGREIPYKHCWTIHTLKEVDKATNAKYGYGNFAETFVKFTDDLKLYKLL